MMNIQLFKGMKRNIKISFVLTFLINNVNVIAQQAPMFTHYMFNTLAVNPAYAGSRDALTLTALHRSQWVDFSGAPLTNSFTLHSPIKNTPIGLGLNLLNDRIGPVNNSVITGQFAYMLKLNSKSKLSLGLNGGVNVLQANLSTLQLNQQADPTFQNNISNRMTPSFGVGAYYSRERFYAGLSVPNLIENKISSINTLNGTSLIGKDKRHYFFIAGAVFNLSENVALKPTVLAKVTQASPIQADVTASFIFMKKLSLGAMYRSNDAVGALVGLNISQQLHIGYSFDWSFGIRTAKYNQGTHEFMLRYDLISISKKQIHSPRYF